MRTQMIFCGDSGDAGDTPVNTGALSVPTRIADGGDSGGNFGGQKAGYSCFVPTVPAYELASGDRFRATKTGMSPLSPVSPRERNEDVRKMDAFLARWANGETLPVSNLERSAPDIGAEPGKAESADEEMAQAGARSDLEGVPWAEWKARALNRIFQEHGLTGKPGRITAETIRDGLERAARRRENWRQPA
jgi:hypothetical protein